MIADVDVYFGGILPVKERCEVSRPRPLERIGEVVRLGPVKRIGEVVRPGPVERIGEVVRPGPVKRIGEVVRPETVGRLEVIGNRLGKGLPSPFKRPFPFKDKGKLGGFFALAHINKLKLFGNSCYGRIGYV